MIPRYTVRFVVALALVLSAAGSDAGAQQARRETLATAGLIAPVEIVTDRWGISHIYAENEHDLFFAQGYAAARDRLFQFEIWRRRATGTVAEILGPRELQRDTGARLFRFRGDLTTEMRHYHERGDTIIPAFVDGINAYIERTEREPGPAAHRVRAARHRRRVAGRPRSSSRATRGWCRT